jgi:predicted dinucleotide-binding enzyme
MEIAILGAGNIGRTLGVKWVAAGHNVVFGVRDVDSPRVAAAVAETGGAARTETVGGAIRSAEVVLFAIPWGAVALTVAAHQGSLVEKILIDASNQFGAPVVNNLKSFATHVPEAPVYRAFNSLGWEVFPASDFGSEKADLFYTDPEGSTRDQIEVLIHEIGLHPVWVGDNDRVELVDNIGTLWVTLAIQQGHGRGLAFKTLLRD